MRGNQATGAGTNLPGSVYASANGGGAGQTKNRTGNQVDRGPGPFNGSVA